MRLLNTAVSAVFAALLTKVGIYAIIRMFTLVFYHEPQVTHLLIGILAALTMLSGAIGAVAYWDIKKILTYNYDIDFVLTVDGLSLLFGLLITGMMIKSWSKIF